MKLSENFKLSEFTRSNKATELNIDNTPSPSEVANLKLLCEKLLQPLRDLYDEDFIINSGYRCSELNREVGGVSTSQHVKGEASDVSVSNPLDLLKTLKKSGLEFDQAILYNTFLHLSYSKNSSRMQVLYNKGYKGEKL